MRLQKYLADCGIASRRKCEEYIALGRVTVNGSIVTQMGTLVQPGDDVRLDGNRVSGEKKLYIVFYKPSCVMCTASDPQGRETVFDYFKSVKERLFTVGRLDYLSEGLLLLTNDGDFANRLAHPSANIAKTYLVRCKGNIGEEEIAALREGVELDDGKTARAGAKLIRSGEVSAVSLTIHEGRNRQVRRMFEAIGCEVLFLKREAYANLVLKGLKKGEWRYLTAEELSGLMNKYS